MKPVYEILDLIYEHIKRDYDHVLLVSGDTGTGKSRLILHMIQYWYDTFFDGCKEDHANKLTGTPQGWVKSIMDCEKTGVNAFDEGGKINSRRAMEKMNKIIHETYQIIRAKNFFTILAIPSIFDLETTFPKRRGKGLFHIPKRGMANFYSKRKLRRIVQLNQRRIVKRVDVVRPDVGPIFFPDYKGVMLQKYLQQKEDSMNEQLERLYEEVTEQEKSKEMDEKIIQMQKAGYKNKDIAEELNVTPGAVSQRKRRLRI